MVFLLAWGRPLCLLHFTVSTVVAHMHEEQFFQPCTTHSDCAAGFHCRPTLMNTNVVITDATFISNCEAHGGFNCVSSRNEQIHGYALYICVQQYSTTDITPFILPSTTAVAIPAPPSPLMPTPAPMRPSSVLPVPTTYTNNNGNDVATATPVASYILSSIAPTPILPLVIPPAPPPAPIPPATASTPPASSSSSSSSSTGLSTGAIVGIVVAIAAIMLMAVACYIERRRALMYRKHFETNLNEPTLMVTPRQYAQDHAAGHRRRDEETDLWQSILNNNSTLFSSKSDDDYIVAFDDSDSSCHLSLYLKDSFVSSSSVASFSSSHRASSSLHHHDSLSSSSLSSASSLVHIMEERDIL